MDITDKTAAAGRREWLGLGVLALPILFERLSAGGGGGGVTVDS